MDSEIKGKELNDEERKEVQVGFALEEMDKTNPGWQIVKEMLKDRAFHTWADPRATKSEREWMFQELNSYWSATNAKELLEDIAMRISRAQYLDKVAKGEIETGRMVI
jgi:hypothetical protein